MTIATNYLRSPNPRWLSVVYDDPASESSRGISIIKGEALLKWIASSRSHRATPTLWIECDDWDDADELRRNGRRLPSISGFAAFVHKRKCASKASGQGSRIATPSRVQ